MSEEPDIKLAACETERAALTKQLADLQAEYDSTSECVRQVYGELTFGVFTKANTDPRAVIDRVRELEGKRVEEEVEHATATPRAALKRLYNAAEIYAAVQDKATDQRIGLVQPVTVAEANELNAALDSSHQSPEVK